MDSRDFCGRKVSGLFPEYGAIFMSNRTTFRECMEKSLLGLPDAFSGFVKGVKAGMILFLFEFEERKLYGVFEALSDGGMNIVPHAYISSGNCYPAQVKFTTIWHCDPLFENEFRDAIRDNYFSKYKFHFGLSKDQIQSLLWLFSSRKLKIQNSPHHTKRKRRKKGYKFVESVVGNVTEIQVSTWKPDMDHGVSVISELEEESLSLSFNSGRKSESIHFDVDAYDPEHPGFHHSEGSGNHSSAHHEISAASAHHEISAEETEDFIPLFSPDHSDPEEEVFDVCEWPVETRVGLDISIPVPQLPIRPIFGNEGISHSKSLPTNGLYSDKPKKKASVFSRLNFSSNHTASNSQKDVSGKKLENDVLRVKQQYHVECAKMKKVTRRTSVFTRLNQSQKMLASEYEVEADGFGEDKSVPEILEKLLQRHANWEGYGWKSGLS